MATIVFGTAVTGGNIVVTWSGLATGDTGAAFVNLAFFRIVTVSYVATAWGTSTLTFEGSNDNTTFYTLSDPQGTAISKVANGLEAVQESTIYYRPNFSGGAGGSGLTVTAVFTAKQPG